MSNEPNTKKRWYFHADISDLNKALRHALTVVVLPLLAICIFCAVNLVLYYQTAFAELLTIVITGSVLFGMIFTFSAVYIVEKKKRRHSRFTFFDIFPRGMVFSEYAGEFVRYGDRVILRRLYYIPFSGFESVSRDPKTAPRELTIKGEIREYFYDSRRLGYHIDEDGNLIFDAAILNGAMYTELNEVTVKKRFGNTRALEASILHYKERFDNMPEKKPFNISDFVRVRKRHKPRTSNPALEAPSYNRDWK